MASDRTPNQVTSVFVKSNANDNADVVLWGDPVTHRLLVDANISNASVSGIKSNNAVVPGATNLGVLPAIATDVAPTYTEGYQVGLSVDLAGALRVTGSLSVGGTTDNSAFTAGTSTGTPAMGFYHSTIDAVTDGRAAALAIDAKRNLFTVIRDAAGNARGLNIDANGELGVSAIRGALPAGNNNIGDVDVVSMPTVTVQASNLDIRDLSSAADSVAAVQSGTWNIGTVTTVTGVTTVTTVTTVSTVTSLSQFAGNAIATNNGVVGAGVLRVTLASDSSGNIATIGTSVTPGTGASNLGKAEDAAHTTADVGVFALGVSNEAQTTMNADGDYSIQATDTKGNRLVTGNIAHDGADAGRPIKVGGRARSSEITAVANDDRTDFVADLTGKQIVMPYANPENLVVGVTAAITDTTSTSTIAAQGAGIRTYITAVIVSNSHATVGTFVKILDGSTLIWQGYAAALGGGFTTSFPTPLRCTANTAVNTQCVTTGANVISSISGYKGV